MSKSFIPPKNSEMWEVVEDMNCHEFGKYLRKKSNGNDWTWKSQDNCNIFFSPIGKILAIIFYSGPRLMTTTSYILKEK